MSKILRTNKSFLELVAETLKMCFYLALCSAGFAVVIFINNERDRESVKFSAGVVYSCLAHVEAAKNKESSLALCDKCGLIKESKAYESCVDYSKYKLTLNNGGIKPPFTDLTPYLVTSEATH